MYKNLHCEEVNELLSAYMDNELSQGLEEAVELHLDNCAICEKKLYEMEKVSNVIKISAKQQWDKLKDDVFVKKLDKYMDAISECRFTEENLDNYIDKELDSTAETRIKNHLKKCKYCRYDYENLIDFKLSLKNYFDKALDSPLKENDFQQIISKLAKARLFDYLTVSIASIFAVSALVWFSVSTVHPVISNLDNGKAIQNINLKSNSKEHKTILEKVKIILKEATEKVQFLQN